MILGGVSAVAVMIAYNKITSSYMKKNETFSALENTYPILNHLNGLDAVIQLNLYQQRFPILVKQILTSLEKAGRFYSEHLQNEEKHTGVKKYAIKANRQFSSVIAQLSLLQKRSLNSGESDEQFQENVSGIMELLENWQHNLALCT